MRTVPIRPALLEYDAQGTSRSAEFDDIYHPQTGALAQARHVFLEGNGLPERWRGRTRFVVLETGFGLGNNFLATWAAWRDDPSRCDRLHFVSIESRPLAKAALASLRREPELAAVARQLADAWPPLTCNLHRLSFEDGRVQLLLAFGDVAAWLPQIDATVDAFFLDGFAPAKNPAMWAPRLFKVMARLAAPAATAATWSAARPVRDGLQAAGFECTLAAGTGGKRDITVARFAPRFVPRRSLRRQGSRDAGADPAHAAEPVLIVGAGLAGCATANALATLGRASVLLDRRSAIALEGSGGAAGLIHGVVHRDDGRHARFHRAAALEAARRIGNFLSRREVAGSLDGLLRVETAPADLAAMQATIDALGLPGDYVRALSALEAGARAGVALSGPAWFYPNAGWIDPSRLARAYLDAVEGAVELRLGVDVAALCRDAGRWLLVDGGGREIARAATVVLANAGDAARLVGNAAGLGNATRLVGHAAGLVGDAVRHDGASAWPIERRRGQVSAAAASSWPQASRPRLPIAGSGYVLPPTGARIWFGATSRPVAPGNGDADSGDTTEPVMRRDDQRENLNRLARLLPGRPELDPDRLDARVAFRYAASDRLPLVGAVPLAALGAELRQTLSLRSTWAHPEQPRFAPRAPGLFVLAALGSRGIAGSALGSQVVAAAITGAPAPLEADLLDAIDPARFDSRAVRRAAAAAAGGNQWPDGASEAGPAGS